MQPDGDLPRGSEFGGSSETASAEVKGLLNCSVSFSHLHHWAQTYCTSALLICVWFRAVLAVSESLCGGITL